MTFRLARKRSLLPWLNELSSNGEFERQPALTRMFLRPRPNFISASKPIIHSLNYLSRGEDKNNVKVKMGLILNDSNGVMHCDLLLTLFEPWASCLIKRARAPNNRRPLIAFSQRIEKTPSATFPHSPKEEAHFFLPYHDGPPLAHPQCNQRRIWAG